MTIHISSLSFLIVFLGCILGHGIKVLKVTTFQKIYTPSISVLKCKCLFKISCTKECTEAP